MQVMEVALIFKPLVIATGLFVLTGCVEDAVSGQSGGTGVPTAAPASASCKAPAAVPANAAALLQMINTERAKAGVAPLGLSQPASRVAQAYACQAAGRRDISHTGSDGSNIGDRLARAGLSFSVVAENTSFGFVSPERTMAAWMASPGHRANILDKDVTLVGIGQAEGSYPTWVVDFFHPG